MKDLRRRFERFCLKNRGKGIPNLMLVIAIGNLAVYMFSRHRPQQHRLQLSLLQPLRHSARAGLAAVFVHLYLSK